MTTKDPRKLTIDTIRTLAMDSVQQANAGHPGTAMALAPLAYVLYHDVLRHNPANPDWPNRDRFVLSAGHAGILQYSTLHLTGYNLSLEELKRFRQWHSKTPGHPEHFLTPGIETTTGPLGQGFANGVGFGIAERFLAERYNRPYDEIVEREVVPGQVQQRVQEHAGMPGREDEPVAVRPVRARRVVVHHLAVEQVREWRERHRRAGMAGVRLLHHVHRQRSDRVDGELFDLRVRQRSSRNRLPCEGNGYA